MLINDEIAIIKMKESGRRLAMVMAEVSSFIHSGITTFVVESYISSLLTKSGMVSQSLGYNGYKHVSCISINDEVIHGVPSVDRLMHDGDIVKIDICAAYDGYCADMARTFILGAVEDEGSNKLLSVTQLALDDGISNAIVGNRLHDISYAIQRRVESNGFAVVRDYAGHGIGKTMHQEPDLPNYGKPGTGVLLNVGMAFAIEPMVVEKSFRVKVGSDGWTVKTRDGGLAAHVEDTVLILDSGPYVTTRLERV
jgi:methionyl aminopeptidase